MKIDEMQELMEDLSKCNVNEWDILDQLKLYQAQVIYAKTIKPLVDKYTGKPTINFNGLFLK